MPINETLLKEWSDYIHASPGTSFVELERIAKKHIPVEGDQELCLNHPGLRPGEESNVVMWAGVTAEFINHVQELTFRGFIGLPTDLLVYVIDGKVLNYPLWSPRGTSPRTPKKPHWLPMAFSLAPASKPRQ